MHSPLPRNRWVVHSVYKGQTRHPDSLSKEAYKSLIFGPGEGKIEQEKEIKKSKQVSRNTENAQPSAMSSLRSALGHELPSGLSLRVEDGPNSERIPRMLVGAQRKSSPRRRVAEVLPLENIRQVIS